MTSFWLAAVMFAECLREICDPSCNRIKSLTFFITDAKISLHLENFLNTAGHYLNENKSRIIS